MSEEIKVNRPAQPMVAAQETKSSKTPWIILVVVIVVLAILGVLFRDKLFAGKNATTAKTSGGYQAVFLTNGQVYFGKLSDAMSDYPTLKDIYYLQVVQPPLQGSGQDQQAQSQAQQQAQISLVKLGNELHGPVDEMHISRNQILFYEDMKSDSQVVKAIEAYKANPSGQTPAK